MRTPRFTDLAKHRSPYASASESRKEGYLRRKFSRIRSEQKSLAEEAASKVQPMVKRKTA